MKSRFFLAMATLSLLIAGCENKDFEEAGLLNGNVRIKATMEQKEATRSLVDDSGKFTWATGDKISVFTSTNGNREFTLSSGNGKTEATFDGTLQGGETMSTCAVYPYNAGHTVSGTTLTVTLPAEYGDFTTDYAPNTHAIMVAKIDAAQSQTSLSNLDFKHLGGVLRFAIDNMPVDAAQFVFTATDKDVTGTFDVNLGDTEPVINAGSSATTNNTVAIKFKPLTAVTDGMIFYVPLPVGEYSGFSIAVNKQDGTQLASFSTDKTNTLNRRTLARIPKLRFTSVGGSLEGGSLVNAEANVSNNTEVVNALNNISSSTTNPVLDLNASSAVTEFKLPASFTSESTTSSELNINYSAVPTGGITVTENNYSGGTTSGSSKGEVNITIPAATSGSAPAVTIQTPTLTAGLYATEGGTATYGEVTATTANNTLIVGNGVTINKLTVNGGNVRVKGNANIKTLEKASGLGTVYIYRESTEAQLPSIPEGFEVVDAAIADMKNVFANGGTYTLQKDLNIIGADMTVAADVTATLDLNGYTITAENTQTGNIEVYGTLTLKDGTADAGTGIGTGKIVTNCDYTGSTTAYALVKAIGENAKVIMESGYVYAVRNDAVNKGQFAMGVDDGGDFTMTGGKIEAGWYAVSGNGNNKTQNSIIEIKGGELISTSDYAIYLPHSGEATISGGTVNGAAGAVSIQRGTLNISNDANIMSLGNGDTGEWGDGTGNQPNCAVMVAAKYGDCTVNISGGNFSAEGDAILLGTGSTSYKVGINISGGTFSDPEALQYLADNANVNVLLNKDYTLTKPIQLTKDGTVTIDLNQKTLTVNETSSTWLSVSKGTVTLKNGKIVANGYSSVTIGGVAVSADATLNVEGIIYESDGAALFVKDHAKLNVDNTEITVPAYAVTTNASDPTQEVTIKLSNSTFAGSDPVLLNIASDVTIDGCTMNGRVHGMVLRGGTATVKNSTITLNYPDDDYAEMSSYFDGRDWGSGNMINIAALTIGNKSPNAYQYPTVITLVNTTVQSTGDHAEYFPALYAYANSGEGLGVTLSYDDQCQFTGGIEYGSTNITVNDSAVVSDGDGGFVVAGSSNE